MWMNRKQLKDIAICKNNLVCWQPLTVGARHSSKARHVAGNYRGFPVNIADDKTV